jgi:hypothetical protein
VSRARQFKLGRPLHSAGAIEKAIRRGDWFIWGGWAHGSPKHPSVIASMPFIYVCDVARRGRLHLARPTAERRRVLALRDLGGLP